MKIFNFLKKSTVKQNQSSVAQVDFDHLTSEGELPYGWIYRNKDFTDRINKEFSCFLNNWYESRQQSPMQQYEALKSFVVYLEDAAKLCKSKGECFEFWYNEILASKDYIDKRKNELNELTNNLDELQQIYEKKQSLFPAVVDLLKENDGILQSEFKKLFDDPFQNEVADILYHLHRDGKLERIKSGRTYILHFRG